jgi:hypothetical protein
MGRFTLRAGALALGLVLGVGHGPAAARAAGDEEDVRAAFTAFQAALKAGDSDKLWPLLDSASQAEAERVARTLKANYAKAKDKAKLEKTFGLTAAELAGLTGKVYLKSKRFLGKYGEVPGSKVDKVAVEGDKATVFYTEEDGDKEKLSLVRQGGKWKFILKVS